MKKQIYDEKNGMSYTKKMPPFETAFIFLEEDYQDREVPPWAIRLVLREEEPIYGKYGMLRKQFLKEHRSAGYQYLLLTGKLNEHLNQIDQEFRK